MADGQVVFEISADGKKATAAVDDVVKAFKQAGKKIEDTTQETADNAEKTAGNAIKGIIATISAAAIAKKILDFGKAAVQAASALEEVQNVVDVTFGEGASQIEAWAKKAGTQFGLTETQAKRFTSTMGAMMKSAGLAGPEIVTMSEDLAGLAADMASFYNMDFETAFQKIRSGISGETEPLKQLGINMSVANLEAFALSKGITKAFDKMSQGEQTMLRYQYLMQATADAQGDFARTSDGLANGLRMLETNFEQIKTTIGTALIPVVSQAVAEINGFLQTITQSKPTTVLDEFAEIDLNTDKKIAEIQATAKEAGYLLSTLRDISTTTISRTTTTTVQGLADAFNSLSTTEDKRAAWSGLLTTLSSNAETLASLTGQSVEGVQAWIGGIAESANTLDPASADSWVKLFGALAEGLPEGEGTETIAEALEQTFLAMGSESEVARQGLAGLGYTTDQIEDKQAQWLETVKRLVNTIPGLNEVINTETGEVKGGVGAIEDYVEAWRQGQEKIAVMKALQAKRDALDAKFGDMYGFQLDMLVSQKRYEEAKKEVVRRAREILGAAAEALSDDDAIKQAMAKGPGVGQGFLDAYSEYAGLQTSYLQSKGIYDEQKRAYEEAEKMLEEYTTTAEEHYGDLTTATEEAAAATAELTAEQQAAGKAAVESATTAFTAIQDYIGAVRQGIEQSVKSVINGFDEVLTPTQRKLKELKAQLDAETDQEKRHKISVEIEAINRNGGVTSAEDMIKGLQSQLDYIAEYQRNLDAARAAGVSETLLASLSDGSVESAEYLAALATADKSQIEQINQMYADVQAGSEGFVDALTAQQLAADQAFQGLVSAATLSVEELALAPAAEEAMKTTVEGIAQGIADAIPDVQTQVSALIGVLDTLANYDVRIGQYSRWGSLFGDSFRLNGSHANGLDYVPFNGYLAQLHEGESVLTAEEARIWRDFKFGQRATQNLDYDALGGIMRDNVHAGGNVYLDGQTVGRVISAQQAVSLRQMQRSGWQG